MDFWDGFIGCGLFFGFCREERMVIRKGNTFYYKSNGFWYSRQGGKFRKMNFLQRTCLNILSGYEAFCRAGRKNDDLVCLVVVAAFMLGLCILIPLGAI